MSSASGASDPVVTTLDRLARASDEAVEVLGRIAERARSLRAQRAAGMTLVEMVTAEDKPLVVELLSQVLDTLSDAGSGWRRIEARVLHDEGLSQEQIAALFGVTRQRVSALLSRPLA